ncbi:GNAT family N-acetyltransferase [Mucilaginibacter arboris]|uniref:N-acetyltransferase n=1 Tax=Mucilaginibacter arboris TaxID=2682090 RepID=A0A7K1SSQ2_9SPHI|nr:GNAT family N-acetyltransferase [Mucilaginibacter arboris]MVN20331.1 N-acetyltransferase [Mucilaginibacter arboris]
MNFMDQEIIVNEEENQFELELPQGLALIAYEMDGKTMSILHTEVPEGVEGQGIGSQLAKYALEYARKNHLKVKNYCRFVQVFLRRHPEYKDIIVQ